MRKVSVKLDVYLIVDVEEGVEVYDVLNEMEYEFTAPADIGGEIVDYSITDYQITDSK